MNLFRWPIVLCLALFVLSACARHSATRAHGTITEPGALSVFNLKISDCLNPPGVKFAGKSPSTLKATKDPTREIAHVPVVPCTDAHTQEVYATVEYPGNGGYPGDDALLNYGEPHCIEKFEAYTGMPYFDARSRLHVYNTNMYPTPRGWEDEKDRTIDCILTTVGYPLYKSLAKDAPAHKS